MKKIAILFFLVLAQLSFAQKRPNIVLVMADDLGYSDLTCYGGEISTPNLDRLAANGLRMNNFYNNARCCPTRASLLTGQYPQKVGLSINGNALTRNGATIAELLRTQGYQTAMVGKWHLSDDIQKAKAEDQQKWLDHQAFLDEPFASLESYPVHRGFQKHYGIIWGVVDYFDPFSLVEGEKTIKELPEDYYITDALHGKMQEYLQEMQQNPEPFFMYLAYTAPHWPIMARDEDIAKYDGVYDEGWDVLREKRYQRMLDLGLIDPKNTPLVPVMGQDDRTWESLSEMEKQVEIRKMQTHAAMVESVDKGLGLLLSTLEAQGDLENTLIIFLADNGASPEIPTRPGYDRSSQTRNGEDLVYQKDLSPALTGTRMSYTGIGSHWANAVNTPYRYWKMESFEGGIHTPMIVHWPEGLAVEKGSFSSALGHVTDILPTILDITHMTYPETYNGHELTALDGQSLLPIFKDVQAEGRKTIFLEHAHGKALIKENMKIVQPTFKEEWEMYDLATDKNEVHNLANKQTEKLNEMIREWNNWFAEMKPYIHPRPGSGPH
ncbi:arylsulfatase [Marinilongibacter aquaticus]|uniref:arylsulfatase n=1 Tax=Marinilongibacter aquaticus TaxID=2975157 RepID=UPI0021BDB780|nr:arylsulfatase [Marinilongibacter aquaticus]UBM60741.1 arylsulfatase [Marinilongibacter aquaticus]